MMNNKRRDWIRGSLLFSLIINIGIKFTELLSDVKNKTELIVKNLFSLNEEIPEFVMEYIKNRISKEFLYTSQFRIFIDKMQIFRNRVEICVELWFEEECSVLSWKIFSYYYSKKNMETSFYRGR